MDQNNKKNFTPPMLTIGDIPSIDSLSTSDDWGMGDVLFNLNRWSMGENDIE